MRVSLNWLKEYIDIDYSPEVLAHMLTMSGLEVEGIEPVGQSLDNIIVARIVSVAKHPNADRLTNCLVDTGKEQVPVVCGAPNVMEGAKVAMALPGITLPGGIVVKKGKIRGEPSMGILLAEDEIGLTDDHSGIMILPDDSETGASLTSIFPVKDYILDISLTPNRPDCASVIGLAREIAALNGNAIRMPDIQYQEAGAPIDELAGVTIEDTSGCPRYAAGMIQGVEIRTSPFWMRYRLHSSGIRAISNVVDISNYVLMEMGQPLHTFDYRMLSGHRIVVARAKDGDRFATLDGQERILNSRHLMIRDVEKPVALAGIMGGINSEIKADTRDVLVESAFFDPITIRKGAKTLGLATEASWRFERGIDIEGVINALERSLSLLAELTGGKVCRGIIDIYPSPHKTPLIELRVKKTNEYLGTSLTREQISPYLRSLQMEVQDIDYELLRVKPPSFRVDIEREIDLIEEVARMHGYDKIPVTFPMMSSDAGADDPTIKLHDQSCAVMTGMGFSEIITYSFVSPDSADKLGAGEDSLLRSFVQLQNPLTVDQSVMRTSILPGLLDTIKENIDNGEQGLRLFEWGNIFVRRDNAPLPVEKIVLAGIMTGQYEQKAWYNTVRETDFFDIKGAAEVLLKSLGYKETVFKRDGITTGYDQDASCGIYISDRCIGHLGRVASAVMERFDIKAKAAFIFEVDIDALAEKELEPIMKYAPFSRFPAVKRDLTVIVAEETESSLIRDVISREGGNLIESVAVFDVFKGEKIGANRKTVSLRIMYRSMEGTLDGNRINKLHERITKSIMNETGGTLSEG
ncbi:MAG: phenylalanine--tRNA ligase subunit beta [Deltaproteobacteria bacterium]|nr:phenylalanine--tRNA ligase subunit beta [Deltaproteobacteria bacterium]